MKRVGLLGGSFDPIHMGHLNLAFELMEKKALDEVWFIPAQTNPFKTEAPPIAIEHRLAMVALAIEGIPQFHLNSVEKNRLPPSYTFHTLQYFIEQKIRENSLFDFFLLLGEDSLYGFMDWYNVEEIVQMIPLLIGSRSGNYLEEHQQWSPAVREAIEQGLISTSLMDISSTQIRNRLTHTLYCGHLLPAPVLQYIQTHGLYIVD